MVPNEKEAAPAGMTRSGCPGVERVRPEPARPVTTPPTGKRYRRQAPASARYPATQSQVTATFVTSEPLTVPEPLATAQAWFGGVPVTVIVKGLPLASLDGNEKEVAPGPTATLWPSGSARRRPSPWTPATDPP